MNKESLAEYFRRKFRLKSLRAMLSLKIFFVPNLGACGDLEGPAGTYRDKIQISRSQGEKYLFEFLCKPMQFVACGFERRNNE